MPFPLISLATRALALSTAILLAGTALAAPAKNNQEAADCADRAGVQFSVDDAQCAMYPTIAPAYGECKVRAAQNYAGAIAKCSGLAAAPGSRVTGVTGVGTIKPKAEAPRGSRKVRDPALQLQIAL